MKFKDNMSKHINLDEFKMWYQNASFIYKSDTVKAGKKVKHVELRVTVDGRFKVNFGKESRYFSDKEMAVEFYNRIFEEK